MDDRSGAGGGPHKGSPDAPVFDPGDLGGDCLRASGSLSENLERIGKTLRKNLVAGDKKKAFREFELDIAGSFAEIILAGAGGAVKGFLDSLLTLEDFRAKKTSDTDESKESPSKMLEKFFTVPDGDCSRH